MVREQYDVPPQVLNPNFQQPVIVSYQGLKHGAQGVRGSGHGSVFDGTYCHCPQGGNGT